MPSPDTSAQGAPKTTDYCDICGESPQSATHEGMPGGHAWTRRAASQEAEARYVVRFREDDPWPCRELVDTVTGSVLVDDGGAPEDRNLYRDFAPLVAELNRVARLLASERERYATAIKGIRHNAKWTGGTAAFQVWVIERCDELLAALEEAGSA